MAVDSDLRPEVDREGRVALSRRPENGMVPETSFWPARVDFGRPRIWSGSLGRPGREIDDRNHYSPWPRNPSVGEFLPAAMLSFMGTFFLLLLEQLCHRRLR